PDEKTANYGPVAVPWRSDLNPIDFKYLTVQYQTSNGSVSGWAAALTDLTMTEGATITQDVALKTLSTHQVKCSVDRPADVTLTAIGPYVMGFGADNASLAAPLEVVLPLGLSEYGAGVTAQGSYADGVSFTTVLVPDEHDAASLALTVPPSIVAPAANATRVNAATSFEWSDYTEGVQQLKILANVGGLEIEVFTDTSTFKLSDLSLSDFGFKSGAVYGWYTFGVGPVTSVDELVTGTSVLDAKGASYHAFYPARYFTAE
ncbi:MAG TPA: hypothetical protein VNG33_08410, partial [Polyangiaceae bacterium]|nr:hypothetical protein [Polyangiaceae bacterium]